MSGKIISGPEWYPLRVREGVADNQRREAMIKELVEFAGKAYLSNDPLYQPEHDKYKFMDTYIHVHHSVRDRFIEKFKPYLQHDVLNYDNLINILIMVKNAGDGFREVLEKNKPYMDRYTILDTGSTDNTLAIAREVLADKRGEIYEEPFINFRDSRNRLLELADEHCAFNIMLDDTYILHGPLRNVLSFLRGDDYADSFSLVIQDRDTMYTSNRVTKPPRKLKYVNLIHEIIQSNNNKNVSIPYEHCYILDVNSEYMTERTKQRKQQDIDILKQMLKDKPDDPRTYYYMADSYICMKEWEKAREWFYKRLQFRDKGYDAEVNDALYYIAAISHEHLNEPWEKCHQLYLDCYNHNPKRGDALYMIGRQNMLDGKMNLAYMYMKKAFDLGLPEITMSVRKHIYYRHLPKDLIRVAFEIKDYQLGEATARRYIEHNGQDDEVVMNWLNIFYLLNLYKPPNVYLVKPSSPIICFVSQGGWKNWSGQTLYEEGLGGSESFTIKYGEYFVKMGYEVLVFCKCESETSYNGVRYIPVDLYIDFLMQNVEVSAYIINRYPEFIPVTTRSNTGPVYAVFHDLFIPNTILINDKNLKSFCCISDWHRQVFTQTFPTLSSKALTISYGIDLENFPIVEKKKHSFIFPSFPNRGLLPLLQMWSAIRTRWPDATLNVFCDMKHSWTQKHWGHVLKPIEELLEQHKNNGVTNHGWVNQKTMRSFWNTTHIWLYPCTFDETCCLTAYEAAASRTLVASTNRAALVESVGDRGIIAHGNPELEEWQRIMLDQLFATVDTEEEQKYINKNYNWIQTKTFDKVVPTFLV